MKVIVVSCQSDTEIYIKVVDFFTSRRIPCFPERSQIQNIVSNQHNLVEECHKINILIPILTENSVEDVNVIDILSLAYLSDVRMIPVVIGHKASEIRQKLSSGMQLMLCSIQWLIIKEMSEFENKMMELMKSIDGGEKEPELEAVMTSSMLEKVAKRRLTVQVDKYDFWEINFEQKLEVSWKTFSDTFKRNFDDKLTENFMAMQLTWLMNNVIWEDIFGRQDPVSKDKYSVFLKRYPSRPFYSVVREYAAMKLAISQVFSMQSSVRLSAIRRVALFNTEWVVRLLLQMLRNTDPNIRGIAGLALSKSDCSEAALRAEIETELEAVMDDPELSKDRLVRECIVLAFGQLRLNRAVARLLKLWRNDPIKDVREAAEAALKMIGGEEVQAALDMTEKVNSEIHSLDIK